MESKSLCPVCSTEPLPAGAPCCASCLGEGHGKPRCPRCHNLVAEVAAEACEVCGLARPLSGWPAPPLVLGQGYDLLAELERGDRSVTYLAAREFTGEPKVREQVTLEVSTRYAERGEAYEAMLGELFGPMKRDGAAEQVVLGVERTDPGVPYLVMRLMDRGRMPRVLERCVEPREPAGDEAAAEELRREISRLETELEGLRQKATELSSTHAEALEAAERRLKHEQSARHRAEARAAAEQAKAEQPAGPVVLRLSQRLLSWVTAKLIRVLPGTFVMGSPLDEAGRLEVARGSSSGPLGFKGAAINFEQQHEVTLSRPFLLAATPVTQAQFESVMQLNPSDFKGPKLPVESVSWFDAVLFCNRLSEQQGMPERDWAYRLREVKGEPGHHNFEAVVEWRGPECPGYRLPTEAEWEYACRAGTTAATYNGDLDADLLRDEQPNPILDPIAWFGGNSESSSQRVGTKAPNPWGFQDMLGNVWEWCWDWDEMYPSDPVLDPVGPDSGENRVIRGGSWSLYARFCRAAYRGRDWPGHRFNDIGFRIARSIV